MVSYKFLQGGPFCFSITQCKIQGQTQMGKCCSSAKKTKQNKTKGNGLRQDTSSFRLFTLAKDLHCLCL